MIWKYMRLDISKNDHTLSSPPKRHLRPEQTRSKGKLLIHGIAHDDFSSNDYLGYAWDEQLIAIGKEALDTYGTGSTGSRLLTGDQALFHELESAVADFKNKEASLLFNSGYQANLSILDTLTGAEDVIFADKLAHASLIDGARMSGAKLIRFAHNDAGHLRILLEKHRPQYQNAMIVTESVFSMDGDRAPLAELVDLKYTYECALLVDEAHATGLFGPTGAGWVEALGLSADVDLIMGTFGKALGSAGAYLACPQAVKDQFIQTCRGFIYTTALPPATVAVNLAAIRLVQSEAFRRTELIDRTVWLREALTQTGLTLLGDTHIIPIVVGDESDALRLSDRLKSHRFWILPIRYPTVPRGQARLRLSLTHRHTPEVLERLVDVMTQIYRDTQP